MRICSNKTNDVELLRPVTNTAPGCWYAGDGVEVTEDCQNIVRRYGWDEGRQLVVKAVLGVSVGEFGGCVCCDDG